MVNHAIKGAYFVLEGGDGCGKGTQSRRLNKYLINEGFDVVHIRDPGSTSLGEKVRSILLTEDYKDMSVDAELHLFMTARSEMYPKLVIPALHERKIVVQERCYISTCCYQGHRTIWNKGESYPKRGNEGDMVDIFRMGNIMLRGHNPDLTVILNVDPKEGLSSAANVGDPDNFESRDEEYHVMVGNNYSEIGDIVKRNLSGEGDDVFLDNINYIERNSEDEVFSDVLKLVMPIIDFKDSRGDGLLKRKQ